MTVKEVFQFTKVKFKLRPTFLQSENVCHPSLLKFSNQKSWKVADSQAQIAIWQKFELFFILSFLTNSLPNSISSIIIWLPKRETHWISWSRSTFHIIRSFRAYKTLWNLRKKRCISRHLPIKLKNRIPGWKFEKLPKLTWFLSGSKMKPFQEFFPHCDPVISTEKYVIDVCHFLLQGSTYLFVST